MKLQRLCTALAQQSTPSSILLSTSTRTVIHRHQHWISPQSRLLSTSQKWHIPQAATQQAQSPAPTPEDPADEPSRRDTKNRLRPESIDDKLPSTRQDLSSFGKKPSTEEPASPWGAPFPIRRRKLTAHSAEIADLMGSTTRAAQRNSNASNFKSSGSVSTFGMPRRQPLTPTARRQEDLANVIGDTLQGGIHSRLEPTQPVRVDPFMGRGVVVSRTGQPLSRALVLLNGKLRENQVRAHLRATRWHERPGLKRKRLKSERWRQRFITGFRHVVQKVRKMKAQGW